ncbi:flavin reductase family protein [Marinagarivorans algicola]|uniref:flavin reductase family protein n=1 Tax=Marinagarivorans algicola TaxID=1513270 RepID=UPI0006B521AB|nr:flavin reductase family protein [Marinagarivorans algicola]
MIIDFTKLTSAQRYFAMVQCIVPRPIAWVLTPNGDLESGEPYNYNLAPYSFFTGICSSPPLIMLSAGKKPSGKDAGETKDTAKNILRHKHFVVHIASTNQVDDLNASAQTLDYGQSEIDKQALMLAEFPGFNLPRLQNCKVAMACRLYSSHEIGDAPQTIVYGEIKQLYIDDTITNSEEYLNNPDSRLIIDPEALDPLARLGGNAYSQIGAKFDVKRPT